MFRLPAFFFCTALLMLLGLNLKPGAAVREETRELLNQRCTVCHNLGRVEAADKDRRQWEAAIEKMIGFGARVSVDEKEVLVEYLSGK